MRLFFALPMSELAERQLQQQAEIFKHRSLADGLRWIKPENYHLTLAFLGEVAPQQLPRLAVIARDIVARHRAFDLRLRAVNWFPSAERPKILAALPEKNTALEALQDDLKQALYRRKFTIENRLFFPISVWPVPVGRPMAANCRGRASI